jgi:hypothetical protein
MEPERCTQTVKRGCNSTPHLKAGATLPTVCVVNAPIVVSKCEGDDKADDGSGHRLSMTESVGPAETHD